MFWKFDLHPNSSLDTILSKEECTLSEILDEDDVLQECKSQNRKLLDFLVKPEILEELVDFITKEPADDVDEKLRYKYPNIACELLISDVQIIVDQLSCGDVLLNKLWTFLESETPLNPLLASFFSKVISLLITRKTSVVLEFLKSKEKPVDRILGHIDTSAIMDLVLRLATNVEVTEQRFELLQWLNEEKLIQKLIDLVDPQCSSDKICNASQALCDLIKTSRDHMSQLQETAYPDPLLSTIENKETLTTLLDHMLHEVHLNSSSDALVGGVCVLLTLLEVNKSNSESPFANVELGEPVTALDAERLAHGVTITLSALVPRLEGFHKILIDPPPMSVMITTAGTLDPPFGKTRLQVMKLLAAVLQTNSEEANEELAKLGTLQVMWELFFQYPWNNFLHSEVEHCINTILCNSPVEKDDDGEHLLLTTLMKDINLIHKITDIFSVQEKGKDSGVKRHGYMGHLTKIANDVYQGMEKGKNHEKISSLYNELEKEDRDKWEQFVSGKLAEINKRNSTDLAGRHPLQSSDDDDEEFRPVSFLRNGNASSYQQAFTHYQMQQMAPEFLDNIGFDEEQFPESDEQMNAPFDRIGDVNFTIDANDNNANSAMFEAACNERIHAFDDNDSDEEDVWPAKEITFSSAVELRSSASEDSESSESEEEEVEGRDEKSSLNKLNAEETGEPTIRTSSPCPKDKPNEDSSMDVDHNDVWTTNFEADPMSMDVQGADPVSVGWTNEPSKTEKEDNCGWAKFDDISSISETSSQTLTVEQRSSSPVAMDTEASSPNPAAAGSAYVVDSEEAEMSDEVSKSDAATNSENAATNADMRNDVFIDENDEKQLSNREPESVEPETDRMNPETSNNPPEREVPPAVSETDDNDDRLNEDAESRLQSDEGKEADGETTTAPTSSKTNGTTEVSETKTTEPTPTLDSFRPRSECERTSEVNANSEDTAQEGSDDSRASEELTQADPVDNTASPSPEKIPVSARNGPSLS